MSRSLASAELSPPDLSRSERRQRSLALPRLRRGAVAGSLLLAPLLGLVGGLVQPSWPSTPEGFVSMLATSSGAAISMNLFVISQVCWMVGLVGLGHLTSRRAPILGTIGAVLAGLGAFGHAVYGAAPIALGAVARAGVARGEVADAATIIQRAQSGPLAAYMIVGTLGTVAGCAVLAVAMIRSRVAPLWVPVLLVVALAAQYVLSNLDRWAGLSGTAAVVVAFAATGWWVLRDDLGDWRTCAEGCLD